MLDPGRCTAQREHEGAAKVERDQQGIHNDLFVDDQLACGDSHA